MRSHIFNIIGDLVCIFMISSVDVHAQTPDTLLVQPEISTSPVNYDADDAAIWINRSDPTASLIVGTDKGIYPEGGLFVWNLDGSLQQHFVVSHPNSVDIRYGIQLGGESVDIAAVTLRDHEEVRIYRIDHATRTLADITSNEKIKVFSSPYGIALYKRPADGAMFVFVSSKANVSRNKIWQIRLQDDGSGQVKGTFVRAIGQFNSFVEGMVADDDMGAFYAAEQSGGIYEFHADPDKGDEPVDYFGAGDLVGGNREGLALYKCSDSTGGYLLSSNPSTGSIFVYSRHAMSQAIKRHPLVSVIKNKQTSRGDGLAVTNVALSSAFPNGMLVWHDQQGNRFQLYRWDRIAQDALDICTRHVVETAVRTNEAEIPDRFTLEQNYPNPFNPESHIRFYVPQSARVKLVVYTVIGRQVRILLNRTLAAGQHTISWDGRDNSGEMAPSGIYLYRLESDGFAITKKMTLLR